uniref:G-protein coupled receptors family 1 profile domain-containing protein n=1 Tax=Timema genevievae TaxID=629358 RepID=A0A7R9PJX0_TIMGE|nr:unnamed protein product [Timema genevievae]
MELFGDGYSNSTLWRPEARVAPRMLGWNVPAEELVHIPEHWMSYPEPNPLYHYTLALLYTVFCFVAVIGNGLVIWIFTSAKSLQTPSNVFVVNLAICDFMMMMKTPIFIYNSFNLGFASGFLGCQIFAFVGSLSGIGAGMTNAFIAYDRYSLAIANEVAPKHQHSPGLTLTLRDQSVPTALGPRPSPLSDAGCRSVHIICLTLGENIFLNIVHFL